MQLSYYKRLILCSGAMALTVGAKANDNHQRPNILYIMSDDHSFQTISAYDKSICHTPNIDRIANSGVTFTNSYVCNSISGPARAVILTGKFSHMNGYKDNQNNDLFDGSQMTFPRLFQSSGYQTAIFGKWHLGSTPVGFDHYSIHDGQGQYYNPDFIEPQDTVRYPGYATDIVVDNTLHWLEDRDPNKPFMVISQFKAPHRNWLPSTKKLALYEDVTFPLPDTFWDNHNGKGVAAKEQEMSIYKDMLLDSDLKIVDPVKGETIKSTQRNFYTPEQLKALNDFYGDLSAEFYADPPQGRELAEYKFQRYMRDYLKCISSVDDNIGRLIDYLEENNLWENTIVIYTSDQGFFMGEHGWWDKRWMYEPSFRTPLLMSYPNRIKQAGGSIQAMVQQIDYAPTLLDYAGIAIPKDIQGESFKPVIDGRKDNIRDAMYYHYYEYPGPHMVKRHYGVSNGKFKLIHFYRDIDQWEMYDLKNDPTESNNLYGNPSYAKHQKFMSKRLNQLIKQYKDFNPTEDGYESKRH